jgi:hypothetical protein
LLYFLHHRSHYGYINISNGKFKKSLELAAAFTGISAGDTKLKLQYRHHHRIQDFQLSPGHMLRLHRVNDVSSFVLNRWEIEEDFLEHGFNLCCAKGIPLLRRNLG